MGIKSYLETIVGALIKHEGIHSPIREFRLCDDRKWRGDFVWPKEKVWLEVEGGIWNGGRHTSGPGFLADCEKYNEVALRGYKLIRITKEHIDNGKAIEWIKRALSTNNGDNPVDSAK